MHRSKTGLRTDFTLWAATACVPLICSLLAVTSALAVSSNKFPSTYKWQIEIQKAQDYRDAGKIEDAKFYGNSAMAEARKFGTDHPFYSISLRHLSDTNYFLHNFDVSKQYAVQELEVLEPLGPDYQDRVPVLLRLTDIAIMQGNLPEAKKYIKDAKILRDRSVFNPSLKAEINCRLSLLASHEGKQKECEELRVRAEDDWIGSVKMPKTSTNMTEYGAELADMSRYANRRMYKAIVTMAEYWSLRGLLLTKKASGITGLSYVAALHRVARMYKATNRPEQDLSCHRAAVGVALKPNTLKMTEYISVMVMAGRELMEFGYYDEALPLLKLALPKTKLLNPDENNIQEETLTKLKECLTHMGRFDEASQYAQELLDYYIAHGQRGKAQQVRRQIELLSRHQVKSQ